ncbi:MAG: 4'-phosphopantetheinyl transferase superfamily protein [Eubacteriales bacterium]|nr:4'-phosphopantetheinyl transferase superfamily protein [Eubacteriales bacterium]
MYLYLHKHESSGAAGAQRPKDDWLPGNKPFRENRSDFSDNMVKKILRDYSAKKHLMISEEELKALRILRDRKGKPYPMFPCAEESGPVNRQPIHYSVSHSGTWWGCMIADEPVGFDLEKYREKVNHLKIAKRYFTETEYQYILNTGLNGFFKVWVRKEAYVKFLGFGLAKGLDSFSVIRDMQLSPVIVPIKKGTERGSPFCRMEGCFIEEDIEAAYCNSSGNPIKEIISL